jgi:hypothetical protein
MTTPTANDICAENCRLLMSSNPSQRFAVSRDGTAVGLYVKERGFVEVLVKAINDQWVWLVEDGLIKTTLCNGQPLYKPEDWTEL